jgi:carbon storage regulator
MLVLSRKLNETIIINSDIRITVVGVRGNLVRLGIDAPNSVRIFREELCDRTDGDAQLEGRVEASELNGRAGRNDCGNPPAL